jgi:hypothetical protein
VTNPFNSTEPTVDPGEPKRDRWGRYLLPKFTRVGAGEGKDIGHTRATTFAKSISDTFVLSQWGARMAIKGLAMRPDLYALTAATPLDDRDKLNTIAEQAKEAAGAKSAASLGTALHSFTEQVDRGDDVVVPSPWDKDVAAYQALVEAAGLEFFPHLIERIVVVDRHGVAGTFDRIARLKKAITVKLPGWRNPVTLPAGSYVVVDLKTGRDLSYGMNEIAIQLGLYAEADAMWNGETGEYEPMPPVSQEVALVIHLPVGEAKAELIAVDITQGRAASELCAKVREWRKVRGLSTVVAVGLVDEDPQIAAARAVGVRAATWEEKVLACTSKTELNTLWREGTLAGEWTDALTELGKAQLSKFATA